MQLWTKHIQGCFTFFIRTVFTLSDQYREDIVYLWPFYIVNIVDMMCYIESTSCRHCEIFIAIVHNDHIVNILSRTISNQYRIAIVVWLKSQYAGIR